MPAFKTMEPAAPPTLLPVSRIRAPVAALDEPPLPIVRDPETPAAVAPVAILTLPLELDFTPALLASTTFPLLALELPPLVISTLPPIPELRESPA